MFGLFQAAFSIRFDPSRQEEIERKIRDLLPYPSIDVVDQGEIAVCVIKMDGDRTFIRELEEDLHTLAVETGNVISAAFEIDNEQEFPTFSGDASAARTAKQRNALNASIALLQEAGLTDLTEPLSTTLSDLG